MHNFHTFLCSTRQVLIKEVRQILHNTVQLISITAIQKITTTSVAAFGNTNLKLTKCAWEQNGWTCCSAPTLFVRASVFQGSMLGVNTHDDAMTWKHFPHDWPFVRRNPVVSLTTGQSCRTLASSLLLVWIRCWTNNRDAGDLRRYDFLVSSGNAISCFSPRLELTSECILPRRSRKTKHDTRFELLVRISITKQYHGKITCYFQTAVSKLAWFIHAHVWNTYHAVARTLLNFR